MLRTYGIELDFSERNMVLARGVEAEPDLDEHGFGLLDQGGDTSNADGYLIGWKGPVLEADDPYPSVTTPALEALAETYRDFFTNRVTKIEIADDVFAYESADVSLEFFAALEFTDWALIDYEANLAGYGLNFHTNFVHSVMITDEDGKSVCIPHLNRELIPDEVFPDCEGRQGPWNVAYHVQGNWRLPPRSSPLDNATYKYALMNQGAISVGYCHDSDNRLVTTIDGKETVTSYCSDKKAGPNHQVLMVGWDDEFPATAFGTENPPTGDGAFLLKNNWGPDDDAGGYFWVSYYDTTLACTEGDTASVYTRVDAVSAPGCYDSIEGYDVLGLDYSVGIGTSSATAASIYTAKEAVSIRAIGTYLVQWNTQYTVNIYTGCTVGNPTSGTLAYTQSGTREFPGFETIDLSREVPVAAGECYSIVIAYTTPGFTRPIPVQVDDTDDLHFTAMGRSYMMNADGTWTDLVTYDETEELSLSNSPKTHCCKVYLDGEKSGPQALGTWVFNGVEGDVCPAGTISNQVIGSDFRCECVVSNHQQYVAPSARYIAAVPATYLWSDFTGTNIVSTLTTSLRLQTSDDSTLASACLQFPAFGQKIRECPDEQFTVEMVIRYEAPQGPFLAGMTGCAETNTPALLLNGYYCACPTNTASKDAVQPRSSPSSYFRRVIAPDTITGKINDGSWHHVAMTWDGTRQELKVYFDYSRARDSYGVRHAFGEPLGYTDDSYWQIGGALRWGQNVPSNCSSYKGMFLDVAAVRFSKGLIGPKQFMCFGDSPTPSDVAVRLTFEGHNQGTVLGYELEPNRAHAAFPYMGAFQNIGKVADAFNLYTNFSWKTGVAENGGRIRTRSSLWSGADQTNAKGLNLSVIPPPEYLAATDFTVEAIVYTEPRQGDRCMLFQETDNINCTVVTNRYGVWPISPSNAWGAWALSYRNQNNLYLGMLQEDDATGAVTNAYDEAAHNTYSGGLRVGSMSYGDWHHLAVTYDKSKTNTFTVWVDYQLVHSYTFPEGKHLYRTTMADAPLLNFFGGGWNDGGSRLHGCVQDIRVTCRALSAEEFLKPINAYGTRLIIR